MADATTLNNWKPVGLFMKELSFIEELAFILRSDITGYGELEPYQRDIVDTKVMPFLVSMTKNFKPFFDPKTWGDEILLGLRSPIIAIDCALMVRDFFLDKNWEEIGLPRTFNTKTVLTCGCINVYYDAEGKVMDIGGNIVDEGKRLCAVIQSGGVYTIDTSIAILKLFMKTMKVERFSSKYAGEKMLKDCGKRKFYHIFRKRESNSL